VTTEVETSAKLPAALNLPKSDCLL